MLKELGQTGVRIPEIGLGTYDFRGGAGLLRRGLECGVFVDTAESYGTESIVGEALRGMRGEIFVATKVSPQNFRGPDLRKSVESSLRRLNLEAVDLLQLHYPNPVIPIEETMGEMARLIDTGKVRFCGVSNFSVDQLIKAQKALGRHPIVSNQVRYNLIDRTIESGLLEYCQANHITVIAYSPLAKNLDRIMDCDSSGAIREVCRMTAKTPAQVVINWCLCRDGVVAIPKASSEERILENCGASDWRLTLEQVSLLDSRVYYRRRNRFDAIARKFIPKPLQRRAMNAMQYLPKGIRRRIT